MVIRREGCKNIHPISADQESLDHNTHVMLWS